MNEFFIRLLLMLFGATMNGQNIEKDTLFSSNKILKIESWRNNEKFGASREYNTYSNTSYLDNYQFYLEGDLHGLELNYWEGRLTSITNYRKGVVVFKKHISLDIKRREQYFPMFHLRIEHDEKGNIERIYYPKLREEITFYPDQTVKSLIITDSSQNELERRFYEFSKEGYLTEEGVYSDSFITVYDTIITEDPDVYMEIPLKNGNWYYYSDKGILEEKKGFVYFTERKGRTIRN